MVDFFPENNKSIVTKIGSIFDFKYQQKYFLLNAEATNDSKDSFLLEEIFNNNILLFSKNDKKYFVKNNTITIAPSKTGKNFNLNIIPIIYGNNLDANK